MEANFHTLREAPTQAISNSYLDMFSGLGSYGRILKDICQLLIPLACLGPISVAATFMTHESERSEEKC